LMASRSQLHSCLPHLPPQHSHSPELKGMKEMGRMEMREHQSSTKILAAKILIEDLQGFRLKRAERKKGLGKRGGESEAWEGKRKSWGRWMGGFHLKVSDVVSSNKVRVNYLAIRNARARWLQEVVLCVLCCESRGRRGELRGPWYYICTETIGRKCILLTSHSPFFSPEGPSGSTQLAVQCLCTA